MKSNAWIPSIQDGKWDTYFQKLYGADAVPAQRQRYVRAIRQFVQTFPEHAESQISVFSAPCANRYTLLRQIPEFSL